MRWLVAGVTLALLLAGCTSSTPNDVDGALDGDGEAVDCGPLVEEFATMTQEEYDGLPEDEQLPEECADQFVPYIPPLTQVNFTGCSFLAFQAFVPEEIFGDAPEGLSYAYFEGDLVTVTAIGLDCSAIEYRNGTIDPFLGFITTVDVVPPAEWADDDLIHRWMVEVVSNDEDALGVFEEAGVDVTYQAEVLWSSFHESTNGAVGQTGYDDGDFRLEGYVEASGPPDSLEESTMRLYSWDPDHDLDVADVDIAAYIQFLGDSKILFSPGINGAPATPYAGIGAYGYQEGGIDLHYTRHLPDEDS